MAKTEVVAGDHIKDIPVTKGANGQDIYTVNAKNIEAGSKDLIISEDSDKFTVDLSDTTKQALKGVGDGFNIAADNSKGNASDLANKTDNVKLTETINFTGVGSNPNIKTTVDNNEITFDLNNIVTIGDTNAGDATIVIDGKTGEVKGLTNTTFDPATTYNDKRAATEEQLKSAYDKGLEEAKKFANKKTFGLKDSKGNELVKKVDNVIDVVGADDNISTEVKDDKLTIKLADTLKGIKKISGLEDNLTPYTTEGQKPTNLADIGKNAANINDVMNAGWNLKNNGDAKDFVTPYDTVDFVNGKGTTAVVTTENGVSKVQFDINTGTVGADETTGGPAKGTDGFVTGTQVADAINKAGFTLKADGDDATKSVVNSGETVDLTNTDKNIVIKKKADSNDVNFDLADDISVNNITAKDGLTIGTDPDAIKLKATKTTNVKGPNNQSALDFGGKSITGLEHNLKESDGKTSMEKPAEELINRTNAATVNDVLNAGFNLKVNGDAKDFVNAYDTVEFVDGNRTDVTFTDDAKIKVDVDSDQLPVVYTDKDGNKVVKQGDFWYKENKDGSLDTAQVRPDEVKATMQSPSGDTTTGTKLTNVAPAELSDTSKDAVNGSQLFQVGNALGLEVDPNKPGSFIAPPALTDIDNADGTKTPAKPQNLVTAVNNVTSKVNEGLNFGASNTTGDNQKLGSKLDVVASDKASGETYATDNLTTEYVKDANGNGKITISMKEKPVFKEVTADKVTADKIIAKKGLTIGDDTNKTTLAPVADVNVKGGTTNALDLGGNTFTGLADNLNDGNGSSEKAPANVVGSNAATVNDVLNTGWNLETNGESKDFVKSYDTVNFEGENGITVKHSPKGGKNNIIIGLAKGEIGGNDNGDTGGNDGFVTGKQVAKAINDSFWTLTANGETDKQVQVKPKTNVDLKAGKNMKLIQDGTGFKYVTQDEVEFTQVKVGDPKINQVTLTTTKDSLDIGGNKITGVKAGTAPTDAVNFGQLEMAKSEMAGNIDGVKKDLTDKIDAVKDTPLNFAGDTGATAQKLGSKISIVSGSPKAGFSGKNIATKAENGKVTIGISDTPVFETLQIGGENGPKIRAQKDKKGNPTGTIQFMKTKKDPKTGKPVEVLTNIQAAPGKEPNDVATVGQVNGAINRVANALQDEIGDVRKQSQAGTSAAMAAANLPQPHDPGKSMVSAAIGGYESQQAIAVGVSTISDNGKWILKGSLTQDTQKNTGAGVGVGYQW